MQTYLVHIQDKYCVYSAEKMNKYNKETPNEAIENYLKNHEVFIPEKYYIQGEYLYKNTYSTLPYGKILYELDPSTLLPCADTYW